MMTLDEVPKDAHKALKAHCKASKEHQKAEDAWELQEFLVCFQKDRHGKITQVKEIVLPSTSSTTEVAQKCKYSYFISYS
jgi:hypothetical protein